MPGVRGLGLVLRDGQTLGVVAPAEVGLLPPPAGESRGARGRLCARRPVWQWGSKHCGGDERVSVCACE